MNDETIDDALLREFLLGKVNDEERARIEGLFLTDSQAKETILAVEQDLIEDYLEGTLTTDDRERFVSRYAQTEEQRRRLRITKSIKDWAIAEAASIQRVPARSFTRNRLLDRFRLRPAFIIPIAVMAMIVIVIAAIWLSRRAQHSAIEQELAQLNSPSNLREGQVSKELLPVTVRGTESQNQLNTLANQIVELRLIRVQRERYSSYQATIRRVSDSQSFLVPNLQPENDGTAVRLKLPSHFLSRGTYQINLSGITADGSVSSAEEYQFTVAVESSSISNQSHHFPCNVSSQIS